ncbi:extensin [Streptomyces sp. NPDC056160]|uniref:extensin n=1 Tax=Streptomyces sp. NPDC056160 TaxID=3345731 RepID=UPI0035E0BF9A
MADEQYRWLDRETAERLLRGEVPDTVDVTVRDRAERLAEALKALSAESAAAHPSAAPAELPGEAAALAAFRTARAAQADTRAGQAVSAGAPGRYTAAGSADAGLVRIAAHGHGPARGAGTARSRRPGARLGRPVRLALSATLAAGALGGVAAAATTGVLPSPFGGDEPAPATSVTPSDASDAPSPPFARGGDGSEGAGGSGTPAPGGTTLGSSAGDASDPAGAGDSAAGHDTATGPDGDGSGPGGRWGRLVAACQDLRDGKNLGTGRKNVLDGAAGGSSRVWTYCKGVLKAAEAHGSGQGNGTWQGRNKDTDRNGKDGQGNKDGQGGKGGQGDKDGKGGDSGNGGKGGKGGKGGGQGHGDGEGGRGDDDGGHAEGGHPAGGPPRRDVVPRPSLAPPTPGKAASPRPSESL